MRRNLWVAVVLAFQGVWFSAWASQPVILVQTEECHPLKSAPTGKYCVTTTEGSTSSDILYFMHGLGDDEHAWFRRSDSINRRWMERGKQIPRVVNISFGKTWLLAEKNSSTRSGLLEKVANEVIPEIELALGGLHGNRLLAGASMGGFNGSQLLLKKGEMFKRVALLCPAIVAVSPHAPKAEIEAYIKRTHANRFLVNVAVALAKSYFPTQEEYARAAPLTLAETQLGPTSPPTHVSCGLQDDYGFQEGAEQFAKIAIERKVPEAVWQPLTGGHCVFDGAAVADFLIP